MTKRPVLKSALAMAIAACFSTGAAHADDVSITREFSANWYDPAHSGHGFGVEVIESGDDKALLAYWFTHDLEGKPLWLVGTGPIEGNTALVEAFVAEGGRFTNNFDPAQVQVKPWGALEFRFDSCESGSVSFVPDDRSLPSGVIPIRRLSSLFGSNCSGGISDDRPSNSSDDRDVEYMTNTGISAGAKGKLRFEQRSDRTDFEVELEDLPLGLYSLQIDGAEVAVIEVTSVNGRNRGEVEFRSPAEAGHPLLTFDPRGKRVDIAAGGQVVLTSAVFADDDDDQNDDGTPKQPPEGTPDFGSDHYELEVELFDDGPELEAELERRRDRIEFKVELEDVTPGNYTLQVGGITRGVLTVVSVPGGSEGELEFRYPQDATHLLLDFDPRGEAIALTGADGFEIGGVFPVTPSTEFDDDGDDDDDNGGDDDDRDDDGDDDNGGGGDDDDGDDNDGGGDDDADDDDDDADDDDDDDNG